MARPALDRTTTAPLDKTPEPGRLLEPVRQHNRAEPSPVRRQTIPFIFSPALTRKLCTVVAPAGYGKTVSLSLFASEWGASECEWQWISLLPRDGGVRQLLGHLSCALHSADAHLSEAFAVMQDELQSATALTDSSPSLQAVSLGTRAGALLKNYLTGDLSLVFEDYHTVQHAPGVRDFVTAFIDAMPAWCHLFLVSREPVALELARIAAAGQVLSVTKNDLRFSQDDVKAYLSSRLPHHALTSETVARLTALTEGWAAGIVLLTESLRHSGATGESGASSAHSLDRLSGTPLTEETLRGYLLSEMFFIRSEPEQTALLATSVAESFDAALAAHLIEVFHGVRSGVSTAELQTPTAKGSRTPASRSKKPVSKKPDSTASIGNGLDRAATGAAESGEPLHSLVAASLLEVAPTAGGDLYRQPRYLRDFLMARLPQDTLRRLAFACGSVYRERRAALPAAEYFLLSGDGAQALSALEQLIDLDSETPLTIVRDLLKRVASLDLSAETRATLYALQAQTEQQLGDIGASETYIELCYAALRSADRPAMGTRTSGAGKPAGKSSVKKASTLADDACRREHRTQRLTLLRLENLMYQSRYAALLSESQAFVLSLSAPSARQTKRSPSALLAAPDYPAHAFTSGNLSRALALQAFALARTDARTETLVRAMSLFDEALTHVSKLAEPTFVKVKAAVLKLRYLVAQELGGRSGTDAFQDYEKLFPHLTSKVRLDALKDRAFDLVTQGDFAAARPFILEASNGADRTAYTRVFFATKFLFAECLSAEGKFEQAASRYSDASAHYTSISPPVALMMLFGATLNAYYLGDAALCERTAQEARDVFIRITAPTARARANYLASLFFAALATQNVSRAGQAAAALHQLVNEEQASNLMVETDLFGAYFAAVTPAETPFTFVKAAMQYISRLEPYFDIDAIAQGYPYLSLKCHWRLAETVLLKLRALKTSPADLDAESRALLLRLDAAVLDQLLRVLIDHKTSLGILGNGSGSAASSRQPHKFIRITTLGDFRIALEGVPDASDAVIDGGSFPRRNMKLALMMLLLNHRDTVLTDDFFERLFPTSSHENRSQMLRNLTSALRRTFIEKGFFDAESSFLTKGDTGYRLNLGTHGIDYFCDAEAFEQLIAEARRAHSAAKSGGVDISPDSNADAAQHYRAALDLYKGVYLPDARFEAWAEFKRNALQEAQVEALVFLAETHFATGNFIEAAALCEQAIAFSPTLAPAYELLIRSYLARHLDAEARHVYQRCREAFRKELNTYPPARIEKLATSELTRSSAPTAKP